MASDAILRTFGDSSIREDVVFNAVEILTARETQIFNMLGKTKAISTIHSFLVDTLRTPSANQFAVEEGSDYNMAANSTPTRLTNIVEILALPYSVSRTQQQVEHYTGQDELTRQTTKALMDWGNAAEFDLLRSTLTSGVSGTAPKLNGILAAISKSTNYTLQTSGTIWAATILDGLMQQTWNNSNADMPTELFMGSFLRKITDTFAQKTNMVVNNPAGAQTIVRTVSSYQTSFGTLNIHTHRYLQATTDLNARVLGLNPDKLKIAFLNMPVIDTGLARSGDYDKRAIVGKFTLEVHNQDTHFFCDGLSLV